MLKLVVLTSFVLGTFLSAPAFAQDVEFDQGVYGRWKNGISNDPGFFPIAVWLQSPRNAKQYREAGINLYVGLWKGPTEEQLLDLKKSRMNVICDQNEVGLNSKNADCIVGWMHGDEPDNAQASRTGNGYDPPILPGVIADNYERMKTRDGTRPVLLNLGQGVAFDNYIGRGTRRNHPEDYAEYIRGSDIVSFDIYPATHENNEVAGKLEFVARGVERLRRWSNDEKIVWNCIECSRISNVKIKPTPQQIRSEVWMSLIRGSRGIIYFVHQFEPTFDEASLLHDPELLAAVSVINNEIRDFAPVLNSRTANDAATVSVEGTDEPIAIMCKNYQDSTYLFAVNLTPHDTRASFTLTAASPSRADVLHEDRSIAVHNNQFDDKFAGYAVHCYRISQ